MEKAVGKKMERSKEKKCFSLNVLVFQDKGGGESKWDPWLIFQVILLKFYPPGVDSMKGEGFY